MTLKIDKSENKYHKYKNDQNMNQNFTKKIEWPIKLWKFDKNLLEIEMQIKIGKLYLSNR